MVKVTLAIFIVDQFDFTLRLEKGNHFTVFPRIAQLSICLPARFINFKQNNKLFCQSTFPKVTHFKLE